MRKRRYREKRPIRLGAMQSSRRCETELSYSRILIRLGFMEKRTGLHAAWGLWQRVCSDAEVIRLSMRSAAKKKPVYMVSVAEPFQNGVQVLTAMNEKQLQALRERIGVERKEEK